MPNQKVTLRCPIRKQKLDTVADSPSGYDHAPVSTCFNCFISLFPFHLCLLKISKAMSMSSWRKMSLSMPMGTWFALYFESTEHKLEKRLSRGRRGGGLYAIAWSATRALQGNLRLRAQTLCLLFAFVGERFHEISLCLTFIGGLLLSNSAPQN